MGADYGNSPCNHVDTDGMTRAQALAAQNAEDACIQRTCATQLSALESCRKANSGRMSSDESESEVSEEFEEHWKTFIEENFDEEIKEEVEEEDEEEEEVGDES